MESTQLEALLLYEYVQLRWLSQLELELELAEKGHIITRTAAAAARFVCFMYAYVYLR